MTILPCLLLTLGANELATAQPVPKPIDPAEFELPSDVLPVQTADFPALTEPPCSYCSTQNRKGLVEADDRVIAWLRASHNGGAFPLRHFIAGPRVVNDTYGLFFYDPDGAYVAAYEKDYGYQYVGRRKGVMVVRSRDGSLWSALTGIAIDGPQQGKQLVRIPSLLTDWSYWLMLHPESTAYDLFDGKRYPVQELPTKLSAVTTRSMGEVDRRLDPMVPVIGVEMNGIQKAYRLDNLGGRATYLDEINGIPIAVFWYEATQSSVVFDRRVNGRPLTFYADPISPESAPFKDRETGTRWTIAGRAIDGPLRGAELTWQPSIQARWFAWSASYPKTRLHDHAAQESQ